LKQPPTPTKAQPRFSIQGRSLRKTGRVRFMLARNRSGFLRHECNPVWFIYRVKTVRSHQTVATLAPIHTTTNADMVPLKQSCESPHVSSIDTCRARGDLRGERVAHGREKRGGQKARPTAEVFDESKISPTLAQAEPAWHAHTVIIWQRSPRPSWQGARCPRPRRGCRGTRLT